MNNYNKTLLRSAVLCGLALFVVTLLQIPAITPASAQSSAEKRSAEKICRKRHGTRYAGVRYANGTYHCVTKSASTSSRKSKKTRTLQDHDKDEYIQVLEYCRKRYKGNSWVRVKKRFGTYYCVLLN